jgi:putative methanogenesis marker protein 8
MMNSHGFRKPMKVEGILQQLNINKNEYNDLHITRNFSSFVAISDGKVIDMTDPWMKHCPLHNMLYEKLDSADLAEIKAGIRNAVEEKITKFGSFTGKRELQREDIAIPYGASEMMMYAIDRSAIDATVTACDGAGTVIADTPVLVQGIGARMNGLFYTTPIKEVIEKIESQNGIVVFPETADINQIKGLKRAAQEGYRNIAVTINGFTEEDISRVREIEAKYSMTAVCLIVCTTGVSQERADHIARYADLVWSCASDKVRETVGKTSILQITLGIPVFVLTQKGLAFVSSYSSNPAILQNLAPSKQYLIAGNVKGTPITMGTFSTYLSEAKLPVRSQREPH